MSNPALDAPIARNLQAALRRAFNTSKQPFGETASIYQMAATTRRPGYDPELDKWPSGWDALGQSGLIRSYLRSLAPQHSGALMAQYGAGKDRINGQRVVRDYVIQKRTTDGYSTAHIRNRKLTYELVARHFGKPVMLESLAIRFKIHPNTVGRHCAEIALVCIDVLSMAEYVAASDLRERGVLL